MRKYIFTMVRGVHRGNVNPPIITGGANTLGSIHGWRTTLTRRILCFSWMVRAARQPGLATRMVGLLVASAERTSYWRRRYRAPQRASRIGPLMGRQKSGF